VRLHPRRSIPGTIALAALLVGLVVSSTFASVPKIIVLENFGTTW
jgi:hypothetical protein